MDNSKIMKIGYHNSADSMAEFSYPAKQGKGVDFLVTHFCPHRYTVEEAINNAKSVAQTVKELGIEFIANAEEQNFVEDGKMDDGTDWYNLPDGTHRVNIPEEYFKALNSQNNCAGFMYDEFEHIIITRNISISLATKFRHNLSAFPLSESGDLFKQGDLLNSQLNDYVKRYKSYGAKTFSGEHVWPVMFHNFARNGIIPNFKSQKESYSNIQFAVASGAALQYKTPLWNCIDLWYRLTFPGHSVKEMTSNLEFAYLTGVNRVYVEAVSGFFDKDKNGNSVYNEYGKAFTKFADEYKGKPRNYDISDYKPEIGIIRYDDSFWGQGGIIPLWKNMLFGNPKIKAKHESKEWIEAINTVTMGETGNGGISWGRVELHSLLPHRSFATMNGLAVFDDTVKKETLQSLKLCFLCGVRISKETLTAVRELVKDGLTVVTTKRYLPKDLRLDDNKLRVIKEGKGKWIVTDSFKNKKMKNEIKHLLGKKGEMHYKFGENEINLKISPDGESFTRI